MNLAFLIRVSRDDWAPEYSKPAAKNRVGKANHNIFAVEESTAVIDFRTAVDLEMHS